MKNRDLKALAREIMLKWYGSAILARFFRSILVFLCVLAGFVFFVLGSLNAGMLADWLWLLVPEFAPSAAAAVVFFLLSFLAMLFSIFLYVWTTFGYRKMLLNICRGEKAGSVDILSQFKKGSHPWKVLWVCILRIVLVFIVLIVPLFIAGCAIVCGYERGEGMWYDPWRIVIRTFQFLSIAWIACMGVGLSFADIIMLDKPETRIIDALKISMLKVTGQGTLKLLALVFSFVLWILLVLFVPIASLFVLPYLEVTMILFYMDRTGELEKLPVYRELMQRREEEKAQAEDDGTRKPKETAKPEETAKSEKTVKPETMKEPAKQKEADSEEEKRAEMASIPKRITFPEISADPNNQPAQTGTEE